MKQTETFAIAEAVSDYLLHLKSGFSIQTHNRAKWALKHLMKWCDEKKLNTLQELTRRNLLQWCVELRNGGLAPQSVWTITSTAKAFLKWCAEEDIIPSCPLKPHDFPSKPNPYPQPLSVEQVKLLFQQVQGSRWINKRNHALLVVLLHAGIRRGELLQMKVKDVEAGSFAVLQKGARQHVVHLNVECVAAIRQYLRALKLKGGLALEPEDELWRGLGGGMLTPNALRLIFGRLSVKFGERLFCHRMRATSATLRLVAGASTEVVRAALGHKDNRSIQAYVRLASGEVAKLLDETSPLNLLRKK